MITIDGVVNLLGGRLLNAPFITQIIGYGDDPKRIKRGSMFIVRDSSEEDIELAIKNGAYAILTDKYVKVTDEEIAWIRVDNIELALLRVLQYEALNYSLTYVDDVTFDIIDSLKRDKKVVLLKGDLLSKIIKALNHLDKVIVSKDENIKQCFVNINSLDDNEIDLVILKKGLLQTDFFLGIEEKRVKYKINLPSIYIKELKQVLSFFIKNNFNYHIGDINLNRFRVFYVTNNFKVVEGKTTNKIIIQGLKNDKRFFEELNFIIEYAHSKIIFVNKKEMLENRDFNFAFLVDCEIELEKEKELETKSLF